MFPGTSLDRFDVEHCDECVHAIEDCTCTCTECGKTRLWCTCDHHDEHAPSEPDGFARTTPPRPWKPPYMSGWHYKSGED